MPELTPDRLREIEARCEAATKGPWMIWGESIAPQRITDATGAIDALLDCSYDAQGFNRTEDARFCAKARQDIPDLLAALKQAREERDRFAAALELARNTLDFVANGDWAHRNDGPQRADAALLKLADPAECLRARDAEITAKALQHWQAAYRKYVQQEGTK